VLRCRRQVRTCRFVRDVLPIESYIPGTYDQWYFSQTRPKRVDNIRDFVGFYEAKIAYPSRNSSLRFCQPIKLQETPFFGGITSIRSEYSECTWYQQAPVRHSMEHSGVKFVARQKSHVTQIHCDNGYIPKIFRTLPQN
jgi:hypothetical protein